MMIRQRERDAIIKSLAAGVVPTVGLHHIQVDRKDEIIAMISDLERVKGGGASLRFVIGRYGAGKSFFLNLTKSVAIAEKFVVLQADVTQKRRLASSVGYARNLYAELAGSMSTKTKPDGRGMDGLLENWIISLRDGHGEGFNAKTAARAELKRLGDMVGGYHFTAAVTKYCEAYLDGDEDALRSAKKWLSGGFDKLTEAKSEIAIDSYIGDKDIYDYLKLWGAFVRIAGFSGLLVLLDEMGVLAQALTNSAARAGNYDVILQMLNECLQGRISGVGFVFAGADCFLSDRKNGLMSHGALMSRLAPNPFARDGLKDFSTPIMRLGDFSPEDLYLLFENIREVFAMGDKSKYLVPDEAIQSFMNLCACSLGPEFYKTPRDAVKLFTGFLSVLEQNSHVEWRKLLDDAIVKIEDGEPETGPARDDEDLAPRRPPGIVTLPPDSQKSRDYESERLDEPQRPGAQIEIDFERTSGCEPAEPIAEDGQGHEFGQVAEDESEQEQALEIPSQSAPELKSVSEAENACDDEPSPEFEIPFEPYAEPAASLTAGAQELTDSGETGLGRLPELTPDAGPESADGQEPALWLNLEPDEPEPVIGLDLEPKLAGEDTEFAPEPDAEDFDFGFERLRSNPGYDPEPGFVLGPGPELYVVESRPNLYDPDILYIIPDNGSSREVSLRLLNQTSERAAAREAACAEARTGEEDMREWRTAYGNERDLKIYLPNLIARNPLIGMERIPAGIYNDLVRMSGKILINAYNNYPPNAYEKTLLSVTLINIAKRWASDDGDAFWSFIGRQLGFECDANISLHGVMCNAIYETMKAHDRFFSQDAMANGKDFYGTVMVHALSPRESVFAWFDFLLAFYRENLRGVALNDDPAVSCLTDVMRDLFESASDMSDAVLKGRRFAIRGGVITLLLKRPSYFKKMTGEILKKLDRLVRNRRLDNRNYIDELLNCWFAQNAAARPAHSEPAGEPAAAYGAIRPRYETSASNSVSLVIPPLRLRERTRSCDEAMAEIICGENSVREDLEVYGDEFAWTVSETRIPLSRLSSFESPGDMRIRVKIFIEGKMIYDSRTSLYREAIIFEGSNEIPMNAVRTGLYSVFTSVGAELSFGRSGDDRIIPSVIGQMRAVKFTDGYGINVNGRIACSDYRDEDVRIVPSSEPVQGMSFVLRGCEYGVWTGGGPELRARIPSGRDLRAYVFKIGNNRCYSLSDCDMRPDGGVIECLLALSGDMITDYVLDAALAGRGDGGRELYRRGFCVLGDIRAAFDKPYYFEDAHGGTVRLESDAGSAELALDSGEYAMIPFGEGYMKVKVPIVSWRIEPRISGADASERRVVWRGNIPPETKLIVACPDEIGSKLKIGTCLTEPSGRENGEVFFDIGRAVNSEQLGHDEDISAAELILESEDESSASPLFPICFRETFEEAPRFEMRDGTLSLKNPWTFVGPSGTKLEYSFNGRVGGTYMADSGDPVISGACNLPRGGYRYRVLAIHGENPSWEEKRVICSGSCILGDVDIFHFDNKMLEIRRVRSGFKEFFIIPVYAENLEFVETKAVYDDGVEYPIYTGTCYYLNRDDEKVYFGPDFNPARIVIINGRDICLYKNDGNKPYLIYESRHKITASKPEPGSSVVCYVPDFYEYEALAGN